MTTRQPNLSADIQMQEYRLTFPLGNNRKAVEIRLASLRAELGQIYT